MWTSQLHKHGDEANVQWNHTRRTTSVVVDLFPYVRMDCVISRSVTRVWVDVSSSLPQAAGSMCTRTQWSTWNDTQDSTHCLLSLSRDRSIFTKFCRMWWGKQKTAVLKAVWFAGWSKKPRTFFSVDYVYITFDVESVLLATCFIPEYEFWLFWTWKIEKFVRLVQ